MLVVDEPVKIIRQAEKLYKNARASSEPDPIVLQRIWSLQAEAADQSADKAVHVKALEKLFFPTHGY